jgi:hypothetical protein
MGVPEDGRGRGSGGWVSGCWPYFLPISVLMLKRSHSLSFRGAVPPSTMFSPPLDEADTLHRKRAASCQPVRRGSTIRVNCNPQVRSSASGRHRLPTPPGATWQDHLHRSRSHRMTVEGRISPLRGEGGKVVRAG